MSTQTRAVSVNIPMLEKIVGTELLEEFTSHLTSKELKKMGPWPEVVIVYIDLDTDDYGIKYFTPESRETPFLEMDGTDHGFFSTAALLLSIGTKLN